MRTIIFATGNQGKVNEVREIMKDLPIEVLSLKEAGIEIEPEENGSTFLENAIIKAETIAKASDCVVLADDSGLEIDALNKEPGIYSARYLGDDTSYEYKNNVILQRLSIVPENERTARFICAMACVMEDGALLTAEGVMEGQIGYEAKGNNGFGYDPIFYLPQYEKTSAEISQEEKNAISHRGQALRAIKEKLKKYV